MSQREEFDMILDSYRNGQGRQFVQQLDESGYYADFIDYAVELGYGKDVPDMMKRYFNIKHR